MCSVFFLQQELLSEPMIICNNTKNAKSNIVHQSIRLQTQQPTMLKIHSGMIWNNWFMWVHIPYFSSLWKPCSLLLYLYWLNFCFNLYRCSKFKHAFSIWNWQLIKDWSWNLIKIGERAYHCIGSIPQRQTFQRCVKYCENFKIIVIFPFWTTLKLRSG